MADAADDVSTYLDSIDTFSPDLFICPEPIELVDEFFQEPVKMEPMKPKPIDQKTIDDIVECWKDFEKMKAMAKQKELKDIQDIKDMKETKTKKRIRTNVIFWDTLPMFGRKDILPSEVIMPNKFSDAGKCLKIALSAAYDNPNQWHVRNSLKSSFGTKWRSVKKHLVSKNRNYLEPGDEPKNNSFLMAKFNGDWQFMIWNPNQ